MDFEQLAHLNLRQGAGGGAGSSDGGGGLCVMELVSWIDGDERLTDQPHCACPSLTQFAIALNDAAPGAEERDTLKPIALRLVGSRQSSRRNTRMRFLLRALARELLGPQTRALGHDAPALGNARTDAALADAARAAQAAVANARRSPAWANVRAGLGRLAEAARTRGRPRELALRDAVYCALTAPEDMQMRLALWQTARAILVDAIGLGRYGAIDAVAEAPTPARETLPA
jgi:hypothetical protein